MSGRSIHVALALCLMLPGARAESLEEVLSHIDAAAKSFTSFTADFTRVDYEKSLDEADNSVGTLSIMRAKSGLAGKMVFSGADAHLDYFDGHTFGRLLPKANTVEIYDGGKQTATFEKIILLGFGSTRAELAKTYDITLGGPDTIGGQATTRIVLTPRAKDLKDLASKIELWIPDGKGYPVQEKITEPSKNYKMVTYSAMHIPAPAGTSFDVTLPPGVKKVYPEVDSGDLNVLLFSNEKK